MISIMRGLTTRGPSRFDCTRSGLGPWIVVAGVALTHRKAITALTSKPFWLIARFGVPNS
jgi:hypothetical protein